MISAEEYVRRLRSISGMRDLILALKRSGITSFEERQIPYKPALDIRSDYKYWRKLAEEKGYKVEDKAEQP
ncbi:MAG: hypothetical protein GHCLOJNM_04162 [bacterium]|nr:hypothetical protein [bacterium]